MFERDLSQVRLDKWLWAARFYKTRALASAAVSGGKVHLQGQRIKPSRSVKIHDCYQINRGYELYEIIVEGISARRGPASAAQELYSETDDSIKKREAEAEKRKLAAMQKPISDHRPSKKERRKIRSFTGKY